MAQTKITISHIHVWDKKNKGDHAIVLAVQELLKAQFPKCNIIDFPVETLKEYNAQVIEKINQSNFLIIGGGGIFYSYFLPFSDKMIKAINVPIYLFGLGYIKEIDAPLWSKEEIRGVVSLSNKALAVGVRDDNTKRFLIDNDVVKGKIKVIGDPAVLLEEKEAETFVLKGDIKVGLNLNYSGWLGFGQWRDDIIKAYREVAIYFQKEYQAQIYYLKHHPGEDNIYRELEIDNLIVVDLPPARQKYVYGRLDFIVGMMLHVGVMAFGALTPEISVAYDIRNYGFAEFIGKKELVVDLDKLREGELLQRVKKVFAERKKYKKEFTKLKNEIRKKEMDFLSFISDNIKHN